MPFESFDPCTFDDIPDHNVTICAARNEQLPIRTETDTPDSTCMCVESFNSCTFGNIPKYDAFVFTSRSEQSPIRAETNVKNLILMSSKHLIIFKASNFSFSTGNTPEVYLVIPIALRYQTPIRTETDTSG